MHVGTLLRELRKKSSLSQLELALRLSVSQRHVSFVESGRARPSRALVIEWANETGAPTSLRNAAMHQLGFALDAAELNIEDPRLTIGIGALKRTLDLHEPYPGLVFDADWNARFANRGANWLIALLLPGFLQTIRDPSAGFDMIEALTHDGGLLSAMRDPWKGGGALLDQLRYEEWVRPSLKPRIDKFELSLVARFGRRPETCAEEITDPYLNLDFSTAFGVMQFFTIQSVFARPQDVTLASLRMELWFPANQATREALEIAQRSSCTLASQSESER